MERWTVNGSVNPPEWVKEHFISLNPTQPLLIALDEEMRQNNTEHRWIVFAQWEEDKLGIMAGMLFDQPTSDATSNMLSGVVGHLGAMWPGAFKVTRVREDSPQGSPTAPLRLAIELL